MGPVVVLNNVGSPVIGVAVATITQLNIAGLYAGSQSNAAIAVLNGIRF
ncbi:MAG TPA: hypothetical protein VKV26_13255 [Dehalococcoidia bacterium]|nr:hypothetical protein [Dehalococcoidia bacterium]